MILMSNCQENRELWLNLRKGKIGASSAYDAADLDAGSQPMRVWLDLCGKSESFGDNDWAFWGRMLEKSVLDGWLAKFQEENPGKIIKVLDGDFLIQHPYFKWAVATPDFVVSIDGEPVSIQIKTRSAGRFDEYQDGAIPNADRAQVLHELGCLEQLGIKRAYLVVFFYPGSGKAYRPPSISWTEVPAEKAFIDELFKREQFVVDCAAKGEPPPIKPTEERKFLGGRFAKKTSAVIDLCDDKDAQVIFDRYVEASKAEKEATLVKTALSTEMLIKIGNAGEGYLGIDRKVIIVRTNPQPTLDTTKFKKEDPEGFKALMTKYPKKAEQSVYPRFYGGAAED